jgi:hypothetical protein
MHAQELVTGRPEMVCASGSAAWFVTALLAVLCLLMPGLMLADDQRGTISVADVETIRGDEAWLLNASMDIRLSSGAREALENGVPLVFELQVQVLETHTWFWDNVISEYKQVRQVQYHALSRTYLVRDVESGTQRSYRKLEDALLAAGYLRNLPVLEYRLMQDGIRYAVRLRCSLDIESLPTPVRLLAYVSSAWDMDNEWYQWPLNR